MGRLHRRIDALEKWAQIVQPRMASPMLLEFVEADEGNMGATRGFALISAGPVQWLSPDSNEVDAAAVLG